MKENKNKSQGFESLRLQAEKRLRTKANHISGMNSNDVQNLIHELEVHQIELEMQNEELRHVQIELAESRDKYFELYDFAPVGYFTIKEKGIIEQANLTGATLLGIGRQSLIGKPLARFISAEDQDTFYLHHMQVLKKNGNHTCEIKMMNYDNAPFYARLESIAVRGEDENDTKLRTAITDITDRKMTDQQLQKSLKEKEVLLQEVHHRVKNNMQVIISLINLQCEAIEDKHICDLLNKTVDRINSMAQVHRQIYKSNDYSKVDTFEYIKSIAKTLFISHGVDGTKISMKLGKNAIPISLDSAIPCGLMINELITNSLKYAFPEDRKGEIRAEFKYLGNGEIEMRVSDDGVGIPENLDFRNCDTLGLQIVSALAEHQLGGKISLARANGTEFTIRFKDSFHKGKI
jgi:PAS domain S-box-containing protein